MEQEKDLFKALVPPKPGGQIITSLDSPSSQAPEAITSQSTGSSSSLSNTNTDQDTLAHALDELTISPKLPMAERMFASLGVVFQRAHEKDEIDPGLQDWNSRLLRADEVSRQGDRVIDVLRWIRDLLDQMLVSHSEDLTEAASILADGARDGILATYPYGRGQDG
ncbi:MAG: hypothetical protein LQ352_005008 [Teloschistes flavicans]|nr:MAG: hypothetical protein LQ352_005008 [Teloschistes flavicans]